MSSFVGIVRRVDDDTRDPRYGERLRAAIATPGHGRPSVLSAPPAQLAFCQKIVTPEDRWERQPATAGDLVSLFDGRIDDREGLAERLGCSLDGVPDGALALAAFRRWGADAPREILGEFAWAVWDGAERRLMLARDSSVSRTLYVYRTDGVVAFATGLRALFALPEIPREVDDEALADFIVLQPAQGERTPYRAIDRVMPGTTLVIGRDGVRRATNWEPRATAPAPRDPRECAEAARELFGRAVQARMRTVGPTAVLLSGGLDSSAIAAAAARRRAPAPVVGVVLVPPDGVPLSVRPDVPPHGRAEVQALARAHPNLRVQLIEPPVDPIESDPTALFVQTCLPTVFSPSLGWFLAGWRAARAAGAQVLMTGNDGEESLTHHGSLRAVIRQGDVGHALREAWRMSGGSGWRLAGLLDQAFLNGRLTRLRRGEPALRPGDWRRYSAIHPDLAEASRVRERLLAEDFPGGVRNPNPGYAEVLACGLRWRVPTMDAIAAHRQLTDLDHTDPFADRRVLEFCLSLPESMFIRDGWTRWLARAAFRDLLPPEIADNRLKAAQNPEWFHRLTLRRDSLRVELERIESSPLAQRALDIPRLRALADRWPASLEEAEAAGPAYRSTLVRGLHAGAFLRWLDPGNGG